MNVSTLHKPQTQDQPRTVVLKPLEPHLLEQFAADMQDAFQTAVEKAPETMPLPILPREDIDQTLSHPGAEEENQPDLMLRFIKRLDGRWV